MLAAFWIQFLTHDWFSHLEEGHNRRRRARGLRRRRANGVDAAHAAEARARLPSRRPHRPRARRRPHGPRTFTPAGAAAWRAHHKTSRNTVTAWWDASQLYGYDETSRGASSAIRPNAAKLLLVPADDGSARAAIRLPALLAADDPMNPAWAGQEGDGIPGQLERRPELLPQRVRPRAQHLRRRVPRPGRSSPRPTAGCAIPTGPEPCVRYRDVTAEQLFEVARLVVAAEIAKIHTLEWTTQLLYDEPLYLGHERELERALRGEPARLARAGAAREPPRRGRAAAAAGGNAVVLGLRSRPGIFGHYGKTIVALTRTRANHFGSPFNFPEEFVTVYRLHPLVPDLVEYRSCAATRTSSASASRSSTPSAARRRRALRRRGLASWALSLGRQRPAPSRSTTTRASCRRCRCRGRAPRTRPRRRSGARRS